MKKIADYLKKEEDAVVEDVLRRKIFLLKLIKDTVNTKVRTHLIDKFEKSYSTDKDTINFLKKFNSSSVYGINDLQKWINGMQIIADRIKARL